MQAADSSNTTIHRDVPQAGGPRRGAADAKREDIAREAARPTPRLSRRKAERMPVRLSARGRNAHGGGSFL